MSEDKKDDVVKAEDYNKVVEQHNSVKTENESLKKQLEEVNKAKEEETKKEEIEKTAKVEEQKQAWEKEREEKDKMIEELKTKAEKQDDTVVSKGIAKDKPPESTEVSTDKVAEEINKELGELPKADPSKFADRWSVYGHYKNPQTKHFTDEQFGKALSLHAGAIQNNDIELSPNQRTFGRLQPGKDVVVPRTYGTDQTD